MYFVLFIILTYSWTWQCYGGNDEIICDLPRQWVESASVTMELNKNGFHRELVTTVSFSHGAPVGVKVLLIHRWPSGIYVDPYQLTSVIDNTEMQILLDSPIDLESPAHKTQGFAAFVYPTVNGPAPTIIKAMIPVHGRYHKASSLNKKSVVVNLEPLELLLQTNTCTKLSQVEGYVIVDAPCTADNSTMCHWIKIKNQQVPSHVTLQIPVGDESLVTPVCAGTLLVTLMCCAAISRNIWKHGIF